MAGAALDAVDAVDAVEAVDAVDAAAVLRGSRLVSNWFPTGFRQVSGFVRVVQSDFVRVL